MPTWNNLLEQFESLPPEQKGPFLLTSIQDYLNRIAIRRDTNVIFYSSCFLQKPAVPSAFSSIMHEDINAYMACINGLDFSKGLTLILHTPGGVTNAAETIVEYLRAKFNYVEVIVPTYAMSAGTMISLSCDKIIMGRQSQLGPIDPQMPANGTFVSSLAIIDQFDRAQDEISKDLNMAHVWAPILNSLGPALLQEAQHAITYSELIVEAWLEKYMFKDSRDKARISKEVSQYFSKGSAKKSHGRRISRTEASSQNLNIEELENEQEFQDEVLTVYHLLTIFFDASPATKVLINHLGTKWIKNFNPNPPR